MNTSVQASVVSPKAMRGAHAHRIGMSPDCVNEADPAALRRISSAKKSMVKMNNAKNRTDKNTVKTLVKTLFLSLTDPRKSEQNCLRIKF